MKPPTIREAAPLKGRRVRLTLHDGRVVERDLTPFLVGPVFDEIRRLDAVFRALKLEGGTIVWPNGADLSPEILIWGGAPPATSSPSVRETAAAYARTTQDQNLADRLARARSWLSASYAMAADHGHEIYIALFIAFNAMYGRRQYEGTKTQTNEDLESFILKLQQLHDADLDSGRATLTNTVFQARPAIQAIVTNFFLRDSYWRREIPHDVLLRRFEHQYGSAERRLKEGDWKPVVRLVFQRCVVLRNQIFHGGVTYGPASRGWESVEQGVTILKPLVSTFADLMERHGHRVKNWEPLPYPRLGSTLHPRKGNLA